MGNRKFNTDIEVQGIATANGVKTPTGTVTQMFAANGSIIDIPRADVRIPTINPTDQNFLDWESDILLVKTVRNFVLPAAGVLVNGSRYLVKTAATGSVQFSTFDGTVTIEYNLMDALGYMSARSEAWVLFQDNVYYVNGEVA